MVPSACGGAGAAVGRVRACRYRPQRPRRRASSAGGRWPYLLPRRAIPPCAVVVVTPVISCERGRPTRARSRQTERVRFGLSEIRSAFRPPMVTPAALATLTLRLLLRREVILGRCLGFPLARVRGVLPAAADPARAAAVYTNNDMSRVCIAVMGRCNRPQSRVQQLDHRGAPREGGLGRCSRVLPAMPSCDLRDAQCRYVDAGALHAARRAPTTRDRRRTHDRREVSVTREGVRVPIPRCESRQRADDTLRTGEVVPASGARVDPRDGIGALRSCCRSRRAPAADVRERTTATSRCSTPTARSSALVAAGDASRAAPRIAACGLRPCRAATSSSAGCARRTARLFARRRGDAADDDRDRLAAEAAPERCTSAGRRQRQVGAGDGARGTLAATPARTPRRTRARRARRRPRGGGGREGRGGRQGPRDDDVGEPGVRRRRRGARSCPAARSRRTCAAT